MLTSYSPDESTLAEVMRRRTEREKGDPAGDQSAVHRAQLAETDAVRAFSPG